MSYFSNMVYLQSYMNISLFLYQHYAVNLYHTSPSLIISCPCENTGLGAVSCSHCRCAVVQVPKVWEHWHGGGELFSLQVCCCAGAQGVRTLAWGRWAVLITGVLLCRCKPATSAITRVEYTTPHYLLAITQRDTTGHHTSGDITTEYYTTGHNTTRHHTTRYHCTTLQDTTVQNTTSQAISLQATTL